MFYDTATQTQEQGGLQGESTVEALQIFLCFNSSIAEPGQVGGFKMLNCAILATLLDSKELDRGFCRSKTVSLIISPRSLQLTVPTAKHRRTRRLFSLRVSLL